MTPSTLEHGARLTLVLLVVFAWGAVDTRGAYADDFVFLAYSARLDWLQSVTDWIDTFNSRLGQALIFPSLLKTFATPDPAAFHWTGLHTLGIVTTAASIVLLDVLLARGGVGLAARLLALGPFAVNPLLAEALLWPATLAGYVFPSFFFLLGTWLYLARRSAPLARALAFLLLAIAVLGIEQLAPLFVLLIAWGLWTHWRAQGRLAAFDATALLLVLGAFVASAVLGKTADRVESFASLTLPEIPARSLGVLTDAGNDLLTHWARLLADPLIRADLADTLTLPAIGMGIALATAWAWLLARATASTADDTRHPARTVLAGLILFAAALTPFMVVNYYVPPRSLYIPGVGLAIALAIPLAGGLRRLSFAARAPLIGAGAIALLALLAGTRHAQQDFARQWRDEHALLTALAAAERDATTGSEFVVLGYPDGTGPSPGLRNRFAVNGMVQWLHPGRGFSGDALRDLTEVFGLPEDPADLAGRYTTRATDRAIVWIDGAAKAIDTLMIDAPVMDTPTTLHARAESPGLVARHGALTLEVPVLLRIAGSDTGVLVVRLRAEGLAEGQARVRLAIMDDAGHRHVHDSTVATRFGFRKMADGYQRSVFIPALSQVRTISVALALAGLPDTPGEARRYPSGALRIEVQ